MKTLFWHPVGPVIRYDGHEGVLRIENKHYEQRMNWRLSRWEMFRTGLRFIWAAVRT